MDPKIIDPTTIYILVGGVLVIFVGLALRHIESLQKGVPLWLWSGLAGILVGAGITGFAVHKVGAKQTANSLRTAYDPSELHFTMPTLKPSQLNGPGSWACELATKILP